jgi:hypothetical protein
MARQLDEKIRNDIQRRQHVSAKRAPKQEMQAYDRP